MSDTDAAADAGPGKERRRDSIDPRGPDAPAETVCPSCGFANPPNFRFCGGCGASLQADVRKPAADALSQRPQPERRQLTVLFCDLVGSSSIASRLDPEELRDVIQSYQRACTSIIRRFDGTVSRYMGDGILTLFGYPRAHEDDAERAVLAALDIVSTVTALPVLPGGAGENDVRLAVRVGIATGLVVVGDLIGEGASEEEAVLGETPNLAARLQALASPNSVVIAAGTRTLIGERVECEDLGTQVLRGFPNPVRAWRALAPRLTRTRFEAAQRSRSTPLVDREETLRWLRWLWHEAERSRGRIALLAGEAGIGKSRVVEALRERIVGTPYATLRYQCSPYYSNTALYPFIAQIERAAGIDHEDTPAVKLHKLSSWLGPGHENGEAVALLGALLSIPPDPRYALPVMSSQQQKERTFELLFAFLQRMAAAWPVPVVFEDVHWMDPTTLEFLAMVIERVREMRALIVLTFRPDFVPPWKDQSHVEYRALNKLAVADAIGLVERVAGERLPKDVLEQVVARTDGVPLFIEELTKAVVDTGLQAQQTDSGLSRPSDVSIPSTLQDSLMARLDQLGPAKAIAQMAGAIGREFSYELLEAIADLPPERLREGLATLEQSGLAYAQSAIPVTSYAFKHALVQEAAYNSMLRSRRRELHLRIVEALENHFPQTARDSPELLAHHRTEAGDTERAVDSWLAAGRRASRRSEYREAIAHLRRGLELIPPLAGMGAPAPDAARGQTRSRVSLEQAVNLRFELRNALLALGETDQMLECLKELEPLLDALGDNLRKARYAAFRCNYHFIVSEQRQAIEFGNAGLNYARECDDRGVIGELLYRLGQSYYALGQYDNAVSLLEQSLDYTTDEREPGRFDLIVIPSVVSRTWLVAALTERGDFGPGMRHAERALEIAKSAEHPPSETLARLAMGLLLLRKGDIKDSISAMELGLELCDKWSLRVWRPRLASTLGVAYARGGNPARGLELARQAVADAEHMRMKVDRALLLVRLGQAMMMAGRVTEACALGREAVEIASALEAKGDEAWARFLIARCCWAADPQDLDESVRQLDIVMRLASNSGARPLIAFCNSALAAVHGRRGNHEASQKLGATADAFYRELGMQPLRLDPVS